MLHHNQFKQAHIKHYAGIKCNKYGCDNVSSLQGMLSIFIVKPVVQVELLWSESKYNKHGANQVQNVWLCYSAKVYNYRT